MRSFRKRVEALSFAGEIAGPSTGVPRHPSMKVLIYTHAFAPSVGGVETYVRLLAEGLARRISSDRASRIGIIVATPTSSGDFDDSPLPFRVVRQPTWLALFRLVREADVIHLAGPCFLPMLFGLLLCKPVVVEHHGYQAACPNGLFFFEPTQTVCPGHFQAGRYQKCVECNRAKTGIARSLAMLLFTFPRHWMCKLVARNAPITEHVKHRLRLPRSEVIFYGILDVSPPPRDGAAFPDISTPLCFAYVGRLVNEKGLPILLQSAKELDRRGYKFLLKFIGDGPERGRLERLTDALELRERVTFTGYRLGSDLQCELQDVTAVVMPSLWEETAGLAAIEQMMRARLVIVSDIGGLGEVVDGAGLKFPPGDVAGLTSCLQRVLDDPSLVGKVGNQARERALALFSQGIMINRHISLFEELLSKKTE
ncbi:MAG TPA: glycosyltransferase family 4 protein [Candidatus Dormibacteraeota bacterium]|nr:glycosyltransferase family 4 protein [Candidatus Dormibacteraeota bacterium]